MENVNPRWGDILDGTRGTRGYSQQQATRSEYHGYTSPLHKLHFLPSLPTWERENANVLFCKTRHAVTGHTFVSAVSVRYGFPSNGTCSVQITTQECNWIHRISFLSLAFCLQNYQTIYLSESVCTNLCEVNSICVEKGWDKLSMCMWT